MFLCIGDIMACCAVARRFKFVFATLVLVVACFAFLHLHLHIFRHSSKLYQYYYYRNFYTPNDGVNFQTLLDKASWVSGKTTAGRCAHPNISFNSPQISKLAPVRFYNLPKCPTKDWLYTLNGSVYFRSPSELGLQSPFTCDLFQITRKGEHKTERGEMHQNVENGSKIPSDYFEAECRGVETEHHTGVYAGVMRTSERMNRWRTRTDGLSSGLKGMGVAFFSLDSLSRISWLRRLNLTHSYFSSIGAVMLEGYNIVGDGTTAVLLPMLAGKFESELPPCVFKNKKSIHMDNFPFVWRDFKQAGYLTSFCNGSPSKAPFNYRMLGFKNQPTDFYLRNFFLHLLKVFKGEKPCVGGRPLSTMWLEYFKDLFRIYKDQPKFLFHHMIELSHDDNNPVTMMDKDLKETVQFLYEGGYLDKTLLILMGDHGLRYGKYRQTFYGKQEERRPYFSMLFPKWFQKEFPQAMANLKRNSEVLTTPFDIHETLKDFLRFGGSGPGNLSQRGISLFKSIPKTRDCQSADITPHYCACSMMESINTTNSMVKRAAKKIVERLNLLTLAYRSDCALLRLDKIEAAIHGNIQTSETHLDRIYQLTLSTVPGKGLFEVTSNYDAFQDKFIIRDSDISRINAYGNDPSCILHKNRMIRQFCYCKKQNK